jgi:hypothetical protein
LSWLKDNPTKVLVMAGAGDIGVEVEKVKDFLLKNK